MSQRIDSAARLIGEARSIAVLTGAGISVESGLSTFRGADGLWEGHDPTEVATPQAFARDPRLVWRFYNERRRRAFTARPNAGHLALAELSRRRSMRIVTQNVDRLHQRAGSETVLELHGNLADVRCLGCRETFPRPDVELPELPSCDACGAMLRPAVVWFGEALPEGAWETAVAWAGEADVLLVVGTSAQVYPAAGLVDVARAGGAAVIEVNPAPSGVSADVVIAAPSAEALPELISLIR